MSPNNPKHPQFSALRASAKALLFIGWVLFMAPFVFILWLLRLQKFRARAVQLVYIGLLKLLGMRITTIGAPSALRPLMIVANHASYLDVFVIGSQLPISFTPKREVRGWPVIGFLCVLADCVFVERRPAMMEEARKEMAKRIGEGRVLCLFPEGTTSDGKHLKPFKSGFLSLAEDHALPVQPASIAYTRVGKDVLSDEKRDLVAWVGEATFFGHFWNVLGMPTIQTTLRWHEPLHLKDFADRKVLTKAAETIITAGVMADLEVA